jgi:hypothetical protein
MYGSVVGMRSCTLLTLHGIKHPSSRNNVKLELMMLFQRRIMETIGQFLHVIGEVSYTYLTIRES